MQQVPELVEEGLHVRVLEERRLVPRPREVADQHALRQAVAGPAVRQRELGVVLVLPVPRVHVEVDPAQRPVALEDVVHVDVGAPRRRLHLAVGDPEEAGGDVEDAVAHAPVIPMLAFAHLPSASSATQAHTPTTAKREAGLGNLTYAQPVCG